MKVAIITSVVTVVVVVASLVFAIVAQYRKMCRILEEFGREKEQSELVNPGEANE